MEASEKLTTHETATVRTLDDRLVIERLEVEDERAARLVRERAEAGQPPADTVRGAIEIGARVLEREGTAAEVDFVKAEFGRQAGELAQKLVKQIESGNDLLAGEIAKSFGADRQGSVQHQIKEMLDRTAEGQRDALARQFSAKDGSNPLFDFKDGVVRVLKEAEARRQRESEANRERIEALTREIVELKERDQADERVAEAEQAGTRKGRTFEERVHMALDEIATAREDIAEHVGDERSDGGGKKGDTVVELGSASAVPAERIVFEAKDRKRMSKNQAWAELNEAMAKRAASFGVLVVAGEETIPSGREQLTEYEGNKMIVAVDRDAPERLALRVAYSLAVARLAMASRAEGEVDPGAVMDAAEEARSALKQAQKIRLALTGATDCVEKARGGLDEMTAAVLDPLARIDAIAAGADDAG
jgi:hypothetical protein